MNYSQSDIETMRKDALRRTREMHSNAQRQKNNIRKETPSVSSQKMSEPLKNENKSCGSNPLNDILSGIFSDGRIDSDKLIIIMLIVILAKEGADLKLLIALGYILM